MHTNYLAYVSDGPGVGLVNAAALYRVNKWVVRIHCHKVGVLTATRWVWWCVGWERRALVEFRCDCVQLDTAGL
jgi:hypothetical protein